MLELPHPHPKFKNELPKNSMENLRYKKLSYDHIFLGKRGTYNAVGAENTELQKCIVLASIRISIHCRKNRSFHRRTQIGKTVSLLQRIFAFALLKLK